jgi:hypothetical protein
MAIATGFASLQPQPGIWNGGCYPYPPQRPCYPSPWPPQHQWNQGHWNLPNANVGQHGFLGLETTNGYAIDLNNNGRYDRGKDGVLAMDLNRDGRITPQEIEESRARLNAMGGNYDVNGDGRTTVCERMQGERYRCEMQKYDTNRDGRLDANEYANAGGRVLVDQNRDGKFQPWENHSPFNFPTPGFGRGRLNFVDPFWGASSVHHRENWWGPCGGRRFYPV